MSKKAFITGITGQDGSYLAELLLDKGYEVHGLIRRTSQKPERIDEIRDRVHLHYGDLLNSNRLRWIIAEIHPDEIYNLGAQSHVGISFEQPEYTTTVTGSAVVSLLEIIVEECPSARFYQASTSELFGTTDELIANEETPFQPKSPYANAKLLAHNAVKIYRDSYDLFSCAGILFNHESERRGDNFVTQKVVQGITDIVYGNKKKISLGNIDSKRDWGYAPDYVRAMWLMLQQDHPDEYVIATNKVKSVRDLVEHTFDYFGLGVQWEGEGLDEKGIDTLTGRTLVDIKEEFYRPNDVTYLRGDYSKAKKELGWEPTTDFSQMIENMIMNYIKKQKYV